MITEIDSLTPTGKLVALKEGQYPVHKSTAEYKQLQAIDEGTQALLLEVQGRRADKGGSCWYALVDGDILVVWEDQFLDDTRNV